eukprot:GHVP01061410.1.p1 GENE.GHVP01061410.1~~GHVP01061410.1.p1  ORF type:complete len:685 (+),score=157.75 GHVP01061410.1:1092-3146(+)
MNFKRTNPRKKFMLDLDKPNTNLDEDTNSLRDSLGDFGKQCDNDNVLFQLPTDEKEDDFDDLDDLDDLDEIIPRNNPNDTDNTLSTKIEIFEDDEIDDNIPIYKKSSLSDKSNNQYTNNTMNKETKQFVRPNRPLLELSLSTAHKEPSENDLKTTRRNSVKMASNSLLSRLDQISKFASEMIAETKQNESVCNSLETELNNVRNTLAQKETQNHTLNELCKSIKKELDTLKNSMSDMISKNNNISIQLQIKDNNLKESEESMVRLRNQLRDIQETMEKDKENFQKFKEDMNNAIDSEKNKYRDSVNTISEKDCEISRLGYIIDRIYLTYTDIQGLGTPVKNNGDNKNILEIENGIISHMKEMNDVLMRKKKISMEITSELESTKIKLQKVNKEHSDLVEKVKILSDKNTALNIEKRDISILKEEADSKCSIYIRKIDLLENEIHNLNKNRSQLINERDNLELHSREKDKKIESILNEKDVVVNAYEKRLSVIIKEKEDVDKRLDELIVFSDNKEVEKIEEIKQKDMKIKEFEEKEIGHIKNIEIIDNKYKEEVERLNGMIYSLNENISKQDKLNSLKTQEEIDRFIKMAKEDSRIAQQEKDDLQVIINSLKIRIKSLESNKKTKREIIQETPEINKRIKSQRVNASKKSKKDKEDSKKDRSFCLQDFANEYDSDNIVDYSINDK